MRAFGTDDGEPNPHACGVDDIACPSILEKPSLRVDYGPLHFIPVPSPVLGVGDFTRALLGRSCQAPKRLTEKNDVPFFFMELRTKKCTWTGVFCSANTKTDSVRRSGDCPG